MDVDELRELVVTLAHRDGEVRRMLAVRATTAFGDDTTAKADFEAYVRNALEFPGFVDYRESFGVAEAASKVLDELENHLNSGSAEIVRWLATFRATSPGWPTLLLADFVDAFDDHALAIYRAAVADLDRQHAGRDHWSRFEVDAMLLELADHYCRQRSPSAFAAVDTFMTRRRSRFLTGMKW